MSTKRADVGHLKLEMALRDGQWPDRRLTEEQIAAAHAVVKANALNASDYELLKEILGL